MTLDWVCACDAPIDCVPARLDDGIVLIGAMDARVHAVRVEVDFFPRGEPLAREIKKAPLVAGNRLIVGSHDGGAYALRLPGASSPLPATR